MKNKFIYPVDSTKRANDFLNANNLEYRAGPYMQGEWLWPREDILTWEFFHKNERAAWSDGSTNIIHFPNEIIKMLPQNKRKLIIQAGGNAGLYPKLYSTMFEKVITFEPDHRWFVCLINNCPETNVFKFQTALGNDNDPVKMVAPDFKGRKNLGANYIEPNGDIPKIKLDSLGVDPDCIHLDIEGSEWETIVGATETIKRAKPLIVVEWNQSGGKYGWTDNKIATLMTDLGYEVYKEFHRDRAYKHKDVSYE